MPTPYALVHLLWLLDRSCIVIVETLVHLLWILHKSVFAAAVAMYQQATKHLDEPLDEGRFVFECILAGNLQAFTTCRLSSHVQESVLCICLA